MKSSPGLSIPEVIIVIAIVVILAALVFPGGSSIEAARRAQAKNDVAQIATASAAFYTEYGYWPGGNHAVSGDLLAALTGSNAALNPRGLVFLELTPAKRNKSGVTNGTFVDPWGAPYQIAFDSATNPALKAATNITTIRKFVWSWNDPASSPDAKSLSEQKRTRRGVNSWD